MSRAERAKGARGQLAVRRLFEQYGWSIVATSSTRRGEAGTCDFIAFRNGLTLAIEVQKSVDLTAAAVAAADDRERAYAGTLPVLVYCDRGLLVGRGIRGGLLDAPVRFRLDDPSR
jgi:hypothetical protein